MKGGNKMSVLNCIIRREEERDYEEVSEVIEKAFKSMPFSDHKEQFLVEHIRKSANFIPELSLVACYKGDVVGYILFSKIKIGNTTALALAPLAVLPDYQQMGVGSILIKIGHKEAERLGYGLSFVVGHEDYYPKFGYKPASDYGIFPPFECQPENFMCLELKEGALQGIKGVVEYPSEFEIK